MYNVLILKQRLLFLQIKNKAHPLFLHILPASLHYSVLCTVYYCICVTLPDGLAGEGGVGTEQMKRPLPYLCVRADATAQAAAHRPQQHHHHPCRHHRFHHSRHFEETEHPMQAPTPPPPRPICFFRR